MTYHKTFLKSKNREALLITGARQVGKILYCPVYLAGMLEDEEPLEEYIYRPDISVLQ